MRFSAVLSAFGLLLVACSDAPTAPARWILPVADPPPLVVHANTTTSPGFILIGVLGTTPGLDTYGAYALRNDGSVAWGKRFGKFVIDFQKQGRGFTAHVSPADRLGDFVEMTPDGEIVGEYRSTTTPETDVHELRLRQDGYILCGVERPIRDMRPYGGDSAVEVHTPVIEWHRGNDVWTWRTSDHIDITESVNSLTTPALNPWHVNAIDVDDDGNLLVSMRNTSSVVKVDAVRGDVLWRLGGKRSDFTFVDDPLGGFSRQHGVRRLPNGHILMFDNGNEHTPPVSRAVEYELNEKSKTARMVWEYRDPTLFGSAMGSAQRLDNGNTLICYGTARRIREVTPSGAVVLDIELTGDEMVYRAIRVASLD